jgi:hypothetical protein
MLLYMPAQTGEIHCWLHLQQQSWQPAERLSEEEGFANSKHCHGSMQAKSLCATQGQQRLLTADLPN